MKIRLAPNKHFSSPKTKGVHYKVFFLILLFASPLCAQTLDKPVTSRTAKAADQPADPQVILSKTAAQGTAGKADSIDTPASVLTQVDVAVEPEKASILITADQPVTPKKFTLKNPQRLVLDFPNARNAIKTEQIQVGTASVKQLRVHQYKAAPSPVVRVVLDLEADSPNYDLKTEANRTQIVFHNKQKEAAAVIQVADKGAPTGTPKAVTPGMTEQEPSASSVRRLSASNRQASSTSISSTPSAIPVLPKSAAALTPVAEQAKLPAAAIPTPPPAPTAQGKDVAKPPLIAAFTQNGIPALKNAPSASGSRFSGHPLTLDLVSVPLVDFFRLMADEGGINIVLDPSVKGSITIKVVKMPWDQIFEVAMLNNGLDKQVEGNLVRIARKATLQEEAKQQESLKKATMLAADLETRVKRLNYTKATDLKNVVMDQKTVRGSVVIDERTNSLVLTDLPFSLDKQLQIIEALDIPQPQVEIEARIVTATRSFARDIGVQFGFVQGNMKRVSVGGTNTGGGLDGTRPSVKPIITGNGAVSLGDAGNYNVNLPAAAAFGGLGIAVGNIMDTFLLDAAITAGESKGWAKLISQPKVIAQNNSKAIVTQGFRFPVTVNSNNTVTVQFFDAALTLTATPQITYDGNIVLDLKIENNTLDFAKAVDKVPSISTTESSTRVLITDGGTTVIGGIMVENDGNSEDRVPVLGTMPLVKNLFRRTSVLKDSQEILFFVTPKVIKK